MYDQARALAYLQAQYNSGFQLCREAPIFPDTYWTCNDNALAVRAFDRLGDFEKRDAICRKLQSVRLFGHDAFKNNGWVDPFVHKPDLLPTLVRGAQCYQAPYTQPKTCVAGSLGVWHEEANDGGMMDELEYFTLACARALSYHKQRRLYSRVGVVRLIQGMWDGTGFTGKGFDRLHYQTMNLSLFLLLGAKCGWPTEFTLRNTVEVRLADKQLPSGGTCTWYTTGTERDTEGNTENTALHAYAMVRPVDY